MKSLLDDFLFGGCVQLNNMDPVANIIKLFFATSPIRSLISLESLWDEVEIQVRAICLDRLNKEISDLELEPGFVIGLQALINVLTRQWAERF